MKSGIINVYKEKGFTSFDVVAKLRGILRTKKIGHTGTLDPDAEGVLPVCIGRATKVCDILTDKDKVYEAVMLLGVETDTQDTSGEVLCEKPVEADKDAVEKAILSFVGEYDQVPPMYSALKVNGKKLYEYAREGKTVEVKKRDIEIYDMKLIELKQDDEAEEPQERSDAYRYPVLCQNTIYQTSRDCQEEEQAGASLKSHEISAHSFEISAGHVVTQLLLTPVFREVGSSYPHDAFR